MARVDYCHRCLIDKCKGILIDKRNEYDKYAYWCKDNSFPKSGWYAKPCEHLIEKFGNKV